MNTKKMAIASTLGVLSVVALLLAFPAMAAVQNQSASDTPQQLLQHPRDGTPTKISLAVGQSFTLTSVAGGYHEVGDPSVNGTASGTMTLQVTGAFSRGYALAITGGSIDINGTTYTITGGSAELGPYGIHMVGQGQAGDSASFLFAFRDLGKFGSTNYGILGFDLKSGSSEFVARLLVTVAPSA